MLDEELEPLREKLKAIGRERAENKSTAFEISRKIRDAVNEAEGKLSKEEVAALLGLERSSLYKTYGAGR